MPRKAPKEVVEHRITLGDFERKEFKQSMDAYQFNHNIRTGLIAGGIGLVAYVAYKLIPGFFDLFETTPEQKAVVDRLFDVTSSYNKDHPEWSIYGRPKDREQLDIMYAQNQTFLEQRLQKANETIALYESMPSGFAKSMLTKPYIAAKEYRDGKHAQAVESLELWRAHYNEKV